MSIITTLPDNYNLLSPVSFKFQIRSLPSVSYFCQHVNVPGITLGEAVRPTPFVDIAIPGDKVTYDSLSVQFVVDEDMSNYIEVVTWIKNLGNTSDPTKQYGILTESDSKLSDCSLTILTNNMNANKDIIFYDCWPSSLSELALITEDRNITVITATATFKYRDFDIKKVT